MNSQNAYTPSTIADSPLVFNIPLYQRLFAWKPKQVQQLLEDLHGHFVKTKDDTTEPPYYLGMLTCVSDGDQYDLIDGQQRFTVMMLLGICFKDLKLCKDDWGRFLKVNNDVSRLKFFAREDDQNYLDIKISSLSQDQSATSKSTYLNADMEAAIRCIKTYLEPLTDKDKEDFSRNVFNRMTFFISLLPESYKKHPASLNKYFEAMNAQGKGLEQHEILKVELLRKVSDSNNKEDMVRIWNLVSQTNKTVLTKQESQSEEEYRNAYLKAIQDCRSGDYKKLIEKVATDSSQKYTIEELTPEKQNFRSSFSGDGDNSIISFSELLLIVLDMDRENGASEPLRYDENKLLATFDSQKRSFDLQFYKTLLLSRLLLDYYVVRREIINGQGDYTLIFRDKENDSEELRQYQAMLAVSTDSISWIRDFLTIVKERDFTASELLSSLKDIDNQRHSQVPEDDNLRYDKVDRYWFWRLDYYLWVNREKEFEKYHEAVQRYIFRRNRSIEHLYPQNNDNNVSNSWPKQDIDEFGNLAMISQSFNSEQSNDNLELKFARIREQIQNKSIQSIKLLKMYIAADGSGEKWTPELAKKHQEEMLEILKSSYPEPNQS